jgi:hypothetical protein
MEGSVPFETKEKTAHRVRAGDVGALTTLGTFARTDQKRKMIVIRLDRMALVREPLRTSGLKEGAR